MAANPESDSSPGPATDVAWMRRALALAARGAGTREPGAAVGCVLVQDDRAIGEGWYDRFGGPHAEAVAVAAARDAGHEAAGCTAYVTLEPCSHHGKTPPCADLLIDARVARVVAAMQDPFPKVTGRGLARLRDAGVDVAVGVCEAEARRVNAAWLTRVEQGRPHVIAKWAQTLDGRTATRTGHSQWISNEHSRRRVHELRARVDAVMVGVGTAVADDPTLTARGVPVLRAARRVVVDPSLRLPRTAQLLTDQGPPVLIAHAESERSEGPNIDHLPLPRLNAQTLDLHPLLTHLASRHDATNVLVEGGAGLIGSMLAQSLIDELWVFVAPKLLGDEQGRAAAVGLAPPTMDDATRLELLGVEPDAAGDVLLRYAVNPRAHDTTA